MSFNASLSRFQTNAEFWAIFVAQVMKISLDLSALRWLSKVVTEGFGANCFEISMTPNLSASTLNGKFKFKQIFVFSGILVHCCNIFLLPYCFCCSTSRFQRCHRWGLSVLVRCSSCRRGKFLNLFHWCLKNQIIMRFVDQFWYIRKMEVVIIEKIILLVSAYTLSHELLN